MLAHGGASRHPQDQIPRRRSARRAHHPCSYYGLVVDTCTECGFEYDERTAPTAGARITQAAAEVASLLERGTDADLRRRPGPLVWSPLEYGCHLRDVLLVQRERVLFARRALRPELTPMGRDERVAHDGYAEQAPRDVGRQLVDAGQLFAGVLKRLGPGEWDRTVLYNWPARRERDLRWVAVHTVHEMVHHLQDIRTQDRSSQQ